MATFIKGTGAPRLIRSGNITVDKYGLATATAVWWAYDLAVLIAAKVTRIESPHPTAPTLACERLSYSDSDNGATLEASYAGIIGAAPDPIDELDTGNMEAPIEAHPNFAAFAGTNRATAKNGAVWLPIPDSNYERFDGFGPSAPSGLRGVTSFEAPTSIVRRTRVTKTAPAPSAVGNRNTPPNSFGIAASWLLITCTSQKRGNAYVNKYEWRAGGSLGWNTLIYPTYTVITPAP